MIASITTPAAKPQAGSGVALLVESEVHDWTGTGGGFDERGVDASEAVRIGVSV